MIYFKNQNNEVFAYETLEERNAFGSVDLVQMTDEEVSAHLAPKPPTAEQARAERDAKIEAVRWRIERAKDEVALGIPLTEPLEPLLQYVQALRDVPQQDGFPEAVEWPQCP